MTVPSLSTQAGGDHAVSDVALTPNDRKTLALVACIGLAELGFINANKSGHTRA